MYYTYILKLIDGSYYTGSTHDLDSRVGYHNKGKVFSTKNKLPAVLIHKEEYPDRSSAQKREYQIKGWKSRAAIERLLKK
jgi:putative endonuclease